MALAAALAGGMADAAPATVDAYMAMARVKPDARIAYGPEPAQIAELFMPKGRGPHPVVILLHGGCYLAEYQGLPQMSGIAADLARRGYAVWNVEYRKLGEPGAGYPGTFLDVAEAIDRLKIEASRHDLDLSRVVAVGHSAGGQLALWAAGRGNIPKASPLWRADPVRVRAVVSLGGIGDLENHAGSFDGACGPGIIAKVTGGHLADTSPAQLLPTGARVVMVHGAFDHVMPPPTGRAYVETMRKAGDAARMVELPDAGHFDPVMPTTRAWAAVADIVGHEIAALR